MIELANKDVLVIGLGGRGRAACDLLRRSGAVVFAVDDGDTPELREGADNLRTLGVDVALGASRLPERAFSLAIVSPAIPGNSRLVQLAKDAGVPLIGELELGFQQSSCLTVAIAGTNGKGTTADLIERVLINSHRKTVVCGHRTRPICSVADQTKELDFLVLQVNSFQLETTQLFRPAVAVLMNLAPDHLDRYATAQDYVRANARLFRNQQGFDWGIIQSDALKQLRELDLPVPGKVITFSATDSEADLCLDRGLLISRIPNWPGPLLDMDHCRLRGPHNAENLMATLAVGHALRIPLESMTEPLKTCSAGPHRFEVVGEIDGVQFINDSKATNVDALRKALQAARPGNGSDPNIWLIAGGKDKGLEYHDVGPMLSKRVKGAYLIGEAAEKIRAAWSLFTPCIISGSLLKAVAEVVQHAVPGDVVLLSPACSSFDQFRDYQERGERFCRAVKSISRGVIGGHPNMNGKMPITQS